MTSKQQRSFKKWVVKIRGFRKDEERSRYCGGRTNVGPMIIPNPKQLLYVNPDVSPQSMEFYAEHPLVNRFLEVSERSNVSNLEGVAGAGKGVFTKQDVKKGTRLAPYTGKHQRLPCTHDCQYDIQVSPDLVICAGKQRYDQGYLIAHDVSKIHSAITLPHPTPPNYGRYFNCALHDDVANCIIEHVDDGCDVLFFHASRDLVKGEELLVDYGDEFTIV
jgi:hypothetical protein